METSLLLYKILELKGIGKVKANSLFDLIIQNLDAKENSPEKMREILNFHFSPDQITSLLTSLNEGFYKKAKENGVKFLCFFDNDYPSDFNKLKTQRPPIISYLGNINLLKSKTVGFCGSRKASDKGLSVAKDITEQVLEQNVSIVSGYASGIDQETHYWALKNGGNTIIVLPEGINHFKIKAFVKSVWDWERVLVISEFNPDSIWSAGRAMERNSTIIALSNIMVLIEARDRGGSIDAGYKTIDMGKHLFAPVYDGMPSEALGNKILLEKGAFPLKKKRETNRANLDFLFALLNGHVHEL